MIIDLNLLAGRSKYVELNIDADQVDAGLEHARLVDTARFSGNVSGDNLRAKVQGRIESTFEADCTRCLVPVKVALPIEFTSEFVANEHFGAEGEHEIDPSNLSANAFDGNWIDLIEIVREQMLLNLPEQIFCKEDCQGICPVCGTNRNVNGCDCEAEETDPRWAALKNLK